MLKVLKHRKDNTTVHQERVYCFLYLFTHAVCLFWKFFYKGHFFVLLLFILRKHDS